MLKQLRNLVILELRPNYGESQKAPILYFTTLRCKICAKLAFVGDPPRVEVERNYKPPPTR